MYAEFEIETMELIKIELLPPDYTPDPWSLPLNFAVCSTGDCTHYTSPLLSLAHYISHIFLYSILIIPTFLLISDYSGPQQIIDKYLLVDTASYLRRLESSWWIVFYLNEVL